MFFFFFPLKVYDNASLIKADGGINGMMLYFTLIVQQ